MDVRDFTLGSPGKLVPTLGGCMAFIPNALPPAELNLQALVPAIARATQALGELSGVGRTLPNPYLLIRPFLRKEAVASSKIEGTVTNLSELFVFEADEQSSQAPADAREVLNYVRALEEALKQLDELPISTRLLRDVHRRLLTGVASHRCSRIIPGEFRGEQNWIGARLIQNARFVPPPHLEVANAMTDLERYINADEAELPLIIKMALVHYQFETIHPFPDGNGRVGRLLMPLMLCASKQLSQPLLYLSSFFESNYERYIGHMLRVSTNGDWEAWVEFFLTGVELMSKDAISKAQALQDLRGKYLSSIQKARSSALLAKIVSFLFESPAVTIPSLSARLSISYNASKNNVRKLEEHGIIREAGFDRPKVWFAEGIIDVISS